MSDNPMNPPPLTLARALALFAPIATTVTLDGVQTLTNKTLVAPLLTGNVNVGVSGTDNFLVSIASEDAAVRWNLVPSSVDWFGVRNDCLFLGWNKGPIGVDQIVAGEPTLFMGIEAQYTLTPGVAVMEQYWEYISADGLTRRRPIQFTVNRATHLAQNSFNGSLSFNSSPGVQMASMNEAGGWTYYGNVFDFLSPSGDIVWGPTANKIVSFRTNNETYMAFVPAVPGTRIYKANFHFQAGAASNFGTSDAFDLRLQRGGVTKATVSAAGLDVAGALTATSLDSTPIGGSTPAAGAFTTLSAAAALALNAGAAAKVTDATTNAVVNVLTLGKNVSGAGVGAAGMGPGLLFTGESSTTDDRSMARIRAAWAIATDASRVGSMVLSLWNVGTETDALTLTPTLATFNTGAVFNETGADLDFRVEGDTNVNLLFVDASVDRVGIGTNAPAETLHVNGHLRLPKAVGVNWSGGGFGDYADSILVSDAPAWLSGLSNVMTFNVFGSSGSTGAFVFRESSGGAAKVTILASSGFLGIGATPTAALDVNSDILRLRTAKTPASAVAAGNQGDIAWDSGFLYVCVAASTWKRVAIATW